MKHILIGILVFFSSVDFSVGQNNDKLLLNNYDRYWEISDGVYRVMQSGKYGVITLDKIVVPCEYQQIWNLSDEGYFRVLKDGKAGVFHLQKGIIIPAEYDQIWGFRDGRSRVLNDGKIGYFGLDGEVIVPCEYQQIWDFRNNRARVMRDGKVGFINQAGAEIIPCIYQQIESFNGNLAKVVREGKVGFIDYDGNEVIPCEYQKIANFENNRAKVVKGGHVGYIDTMGNAIIAPIYSQIWDFEKDSAKAIIDGNMVYIDTLGNVLDTIFINTSVNNIENIKNKSNINENYTDTAVCIQIGKNGIRIKDKGDNVTVLFNKNVKNKEGNRTFKGHLQGVDLGYNSYVTDKFSTVYPSDYHFLNLNSLKSKGFNIHFLQESIHIVPSRNFGFVVGLGLEFNNYRFDSRNILIVNSEGNIDYEITERSVHKNKLATLYLDVPLLLEYQFSVNKDKHLMYVSAGVVGGVRLKSHTKVVYNDGGAKDKNKSRGNYNLQDIRYGIMFRAGYRVINIFGTYSISPLFKNKSDPQLYPISVGLSLYPEWF